MVKKYSVEKFLALKPSEKIRLALEDLQACEKDTKKYRIDMGEWIEFRPSESDPWRNQCVVCFAGSCLNHRLGQTNYDCVGPQLRTMASGLDDIRTGNLDAALGELMPPGSDVPEKFHKELTEKVQSGKTLMPDYDSERKEWFKKVREIADLFERNGV